MNSSNKPSKLPYPPNLSSEVGQFISANQAEFAELLTFVDFAEKFTLGFVEINFAPEAEFLIEALRSEAACHEIQFFVIELFDQNLRFVRDQILEILPTIPRESNKKLVLIVRGLEKSIGVFGDSPPVLQDLNFVRDAYRRTVPHPILFILPDYAITRLAKFAPDFWAWKSGIFRFKTTQATRDYAVEKTLNPEIKTERLPREEQQERIDLLERLLMENQPTGHCATGENLRSYNNILHQLGVAYLTQRDPAKAREYLEEAVKKVERNSSFHGEILNTLGRAYEQQRQLEMAISCHQKALEISRNLENTRGEAAALFYLGNAYLELRQFIKARDFYQQCLEMEQLIGDRYSQASTLHHLGIVAQALREWQQARDFYQQCLEMEQLIGDHYSQARTLHQLGRVAQELREYEQAKSYYQQALDIKIEFSDRFSQASTLHQLGRVAQELREYEQAKSYYQQVLDIKIEFSDRFSQARIYFHIGRVAEELGDYPKAKANFEKALEIFVEYKDEYHEAIVRRGLEGISNSPSEPEI
jgi:tetratricopeptide (TPR) repeat protein